MSAQRRVLDRCGEGLRRHRAQIDRMRLHRCAQIWNFRRWAAALVRTKIDRRGDAAPAFRIANQALARCEAGFAHRRVRPAVPHHEVQGGHPPAAVSAHRGAARCWWDSHLGGGLRHAGWADRQGVRRNAPVWLRPQRDGLPQAAIPGRGPRVHRHDCVAGHRVAVPRAGRVRDHWAPPIHLSHWMDEPRAQASCASERAVIPQTWVSQESRQQEGPRRDCLLIQNRRRRLCDDDDVRLLHAAPACHRAAMRVHARPGHRALVLGWATIDCCPAGRYWSSPAADPCGVKKRRDSMGWMAPGHRDSASR